MPKITINMPEAVYDQFRAAAAAEGIEEPTDYIALQIKRVLSMSLNERAMRAVQAQIAAIPAPIVTTEDVPDA